jgi:hypothetical protein
VSVSSTRAIGLALAAALVACGDRGAGAPPDGDGHGARPAARTAAGRTRAGPERGDRHARASARRKPGVEQVEGTLASVGERQVVISRPGAPDLTLRVPSRASVTVNGRPGRLEALPEGAEIRAAYSSGEGGRPTALSLEARSTSSTRDPDGRGRGAPDDPGSH